MSLQLHYSIPSLYCMTSTHVVCRKYIRKRHSHPCRSSSKAICVYFICGSWVCAAKMCSDRCVLFLKSYLKIVVSGIYVFKCTVLWLLCRWWNTSSVSKRLIFTLFSEILKYLLGHHCLEGMATKRESLIKAIDHLAAFIKIHKVLLKDLLRQVSISQQTI